MNFPKPLDPRLLLLIQQLKNKRARIVAEHILAHGSITTEEITSVYGYKHPPRAVRDLREAGVPVETFAVFDPNGKTIAAYRFGNPDDIKENRLAGRRTFPKQLKLNLYAQQSGRCSVCNTAWEMRYLQVDHCVPYEVAGELNSDDIASYQLLCGECNRAKSWSCEHCPNFTAQSIAVCHGCYWASPLSYQHVATQLIRRLLLTWQGQEIEILEQLVRNAGEENLDNPITLKHF